MKAAVYALVLFLAPFAMADEIWDGTGATYTVDGQQTATYTVHVVNTSVSANVIQSDATITMADGSIKSINQTLTQNGVKWTDQSNLGAGGGACYGTGTCENYIADTLGNAYSTTIFAVDATHQTEMTVILVNGQATEVLRESLTRTQ